MTARLTAVLLLVCATLPAEGLRAPASVARGSWFVVSTLDVDILRVRILDAEGAEVAASPGFRLPVDAEHEVALALVGAPNYLAPGDYQLIVETRSASGTATIERLPLEVEDRAFIRARIPLSSAMTLLRTDESLRRAAESAELAELLGRADPEAVYHWGLFANPVPEGRESSAYGDRRTYVYSDGSEANSIHFGLDIAAPTGTPIRAPGAGRVVMAKDRLISGLTVVIEHLPGVFGLFYHLDELRVAVGELVRRGDVIGTVGATGLVTGPHLHWEVRLALVPVDPALLMAAPLVDIAEIFNTLIASP